MRSFISLLYADVFFNSFQKDLPDMILLKSHNFLKPKRVMNEDKIFAI